MLYTAVGGECLDPMVVHSENLAGSPEIDVISDNREMETMRFDASPPEGEG